MNVLNSKDERSFDEATRARLLGMGLEELKEFSASRDRLFVALENLTQVAGDGALRRVDRLKRQLQVFEPSVTMIGQIKSGKTSLVNALIGRPDLLPADVNPWTSVVTSLHLHPKESEVDEKASFHFFDTDEWDRLVSAGGRSGEMASQTGAESELEKIKEQVSQMRQKSRERLGRKFEMLLGQKREYGYFDKELIERYVCLGEDFDDEESPLGGETQGRFADITKSAELVMHRPSLSVRLCLRDTPGVNDTFMMREQVTIRAIRDSRTCVVVLAAHQALSSTDMAIIRLISQVKSRDVIIFINRIDELSDPASQVPQIKAGIEETLKKHKGLGGTQLIFGSALWANAALRNDVDALPPSSALALQNWASDGADERECISVRNKPSNSDVWRLSRASELLSAIARRIVLGQGAALLQKVGVSGHNLASGLVTAGMLSVNAETRQSVGRIDSQEARREMARIASEQASEFDRRFSEIISGTRDRMARAQNSFLDRATAALIRHLETYGEQTPWTHDPTGLRLLLNSSHRVFAQKANQCFTEIAKNTADQISVLYSATFSVPLEEVQIIPPRAPRVPPAVSVGRTIALDLSASWWQRWWLQRRGYTAYAESFRDLIRSETDPVISELADDLAQSVKVEASSVLDAFIDEHLTAFDALDALKTEKPEGVSEYLQKNGSARTQDLIKQTLQTLNGYATT